MSVTGRKGSADRSSQRCPVLTSTSPARGSSQAEPALSSQDAPQHPSCQLETELDVSGAGSAAIVVIPLTGNQPRCLDLECFLITDECYLFIYFKPDLHM